MASLNTALLKHVAVVISSGVMILTLEVICTPVQSYDVCRVDRLFGRMEFCPKVSLCQLLHVVSCTKAVVGRQAPPLNLNLLRTAVHCWWQYEALALHGPTWPCTCGSC
jgi:hypothetical protein